MLEEQPVKKKRHRRTKAEMEAARQAEAQAKQQPAAKKYEADKDAQPPDLMRMDLMEYAMINYCMCYCKQTGSDCFRPTIRNGIATFKLDCRMTHCPLFPYTDGATYVTTPKRKLDK